MNAPRVRIAPSPTGYFHVGTARAALFNWLFARQHGGTFILRIEDTDNARNRLEHAEGIQRALEWLGLDWDEGPYFQSERRALYDTAIDKLLADGAVYACDCSPEQVKARAAERKAAGGKATPGYDGHCRDRGLEPGPGRMLRFRSPTGISTGFDDLVRGHPTSDFSEDFGVRKSNGDPLFLLANVVDDAEMAITHVIRGEDHTTNTHKYLLLWDALGYGEHPVFAHLPLLLNDQRKKLSKRRDKVAVEDYRDDGFLPEAVVNYLALLGWAPSGDREILSRQALIDEFRLEDVKSAGAIFDVRKMTSINAEYIRALPAVDLVSRAQSWLEGRWAPIAPLVQERARTLGEVFAMSDFLFLPELTIDAQVWDRGIKRQPAFAGILEAAAKRYAEVDPWDAGVLRDATVAAGEDCEVRKLGDAQAPIRLAVTGRSVGPPLFESLELLGRDKTLARIAAARQRLEDAAGNS